MSNIAIIMKVTSYLHSKRGVVWRNCAGAGRTAHEYESDVESFKGNEEV